MVDVGRQLFEMKLQELANRFEIKGWEGPCVQTPEDAAAEQAYRGSPVHPRWEVWMQKLSKGTPNSRKEGETGLPLRAAIWFDEDGTDDATVLGMAYRLTIAVASREAHEALEWTRFDGEFLVDPHVPSEIGPASKHVAEYLASGAGEN